MDSNNENAALLEQRKTEHIDLCETQDVEATSATTLLEQVHLLHHSLPELDDADLSTSVEFLGRHQALPWVIVGMTGGATRAQDINRRLAAFAQQHGLAMGLGSQRAMLRNPELARTYQVRDVAPDILLFGNIGAVQAAQSPTTEIADLVATVGANALCVHLNPAQELIQEHGDRSFRGCMEAINRLQQELPVPVIVKETGCGMSPAVLAMLRRHHVRAVDVSGAGGTTWTGVETLRARGAHEVLGRTFWDWGIPTAVSTIWAAEAGFEVIASGGVRSGMDAVRALAAGARLAGAALPFLRALADGGEPALNTLLEEWNLTLRTALMLTGSATPADLAWAPRVMGPELQRWLNPVTPVRPPRPTGFGRS